MIEIPNTDHLYSNYEIPSKNWKIPNTTISYTPRNGEAKNYIILLSNSMTYPPPHNSLKSITPYLVL